MLDVGEHGDQRHLEFAIDGFQLIGDEQWGQPVLELHIDDASKLDHALAALEGTVQIGPEPPEPQPIVIDVIRS